MELIPQLVAVCAVMALLAGLLWWRRDHGTHWRRSKAPRRLEAIERLPLTPHHSLHLVRAAGRTLLVAVSPSGCALLESWESPAADAARGGAC
jgi:flagellar biogenesis protein FliO